MLRWALIFLIIALVAALFGIGGISHESMPIGAFLALVCLILAIGFFALHRRAKRKP